MAILSYVAPTGDRIEHRMFGAKIGMLHGPDDANSYTSAMSYLNVQSIRIGDALHFDVSRPFVAVVDAMIDNSPAVEGDVVSIAESLEWAVNNGTSVIMTIPTANLFQTAVDHDVYAPRELDASKIAAVKAYVKKLLTQGDTGPDALADAPIDAIEIGNEYWNADMTSVEYGRAANAVAIAAQQAMDELGIPVESQPKIIVQMGSPFAREFEGASRRGGEPVGPYGDLPWFEKIEKANADIMAQISDRAFHAIDGLVEHYYHVNPADIFRNTARDIRFIEYDWNQWERAGYGDKDLYITEWNNKQVNYTQFGLKGAGVLLEQFENMVRLGVDGANIWPFQHNYTNLVVRLPDEPAVTPRGEIFRLMAESLPGTRLLESNLTTASGQDYELSAYSSRDSYVFFIASRVEGRQSVDLDLSQIVTSVGSISAVRLGIDAVNENSIFDPNALAVVTELSDFGSISDLNFVLDPYEVIRVVVTTERGFTRKGGAGDDTLEGGNGHDLIYGYSSRDVLIGRGGDDSLYGGDGNDTIIGDRGNKVVLGGDGRDTVVFLQNTNISVDLNKTVTQNTGLGFWTIRQVENVVSAGGADVIWGNGVKNVIRSQGGNDIIRPGGGNDAVYSGFGNDIIHHTSGADIIDGGAGTDTLVLRSLISVNLSLRTGQNAHGLSITDVENIVASSGDDFVAGDANNNAIFGERGDDGLFGFGGDDRIYGGANRDRLYGGTGHDQLDGGSGDDQLYGSLGSDQLTGGIGNDTFHFDGPEFGGDAIFDFNLGADEQDQLAFAVAGFGGGLVAGALAARALRVHATDRSDALDADDRFIFNSVTKSLWFDADGVGGAAAMRVVTLQPSAADLTVADFLLY